MTTQRKSAGAGDKPDQPATLVTKIAAAMAEAGEVTKSSRNTEQGYLYASVEQILEATRGPLLRAGVVLFQRPASIEEAEITSRSGSKGSQVTVKLDFEFRDGETGESYSIDGWAGQGIDYGDKAFGKAYTNAVKTFIRAQWLLPTGDDPEQDGTPAWAKPAAAAQKAKMVEVLEGEIGNRRAAQLYAKQLADTIGCFPAIVAAWITALPDHREAAAAAAAAGATPTDPAAAVDVDRQAASGEPEERLEPQTHDPDPDDSHAPDPEGDRAAAPANDPQPGDSNVALGDPVEEPGPGTVPDTPESREEVCICKDPESDEGRDAACPIKGHGIAF